MTQRERILKYLEDFGSITQLYDMRDLGIMRLASRVSDLKKDGYKIVKHTEKGVNRYGDATFYARYELVKE